MENPIATAKGTFYSGMTLAQAKAIKRDKCTFRRDFGNIDLDNDGILSDFEILKERKKEAKDKKKSIYVWLSFVLIDILSLGLRMDPKFDVLELAFDLLGVACGVKDRTDSQRIEAENAEIEKRLNITA